MRKIGLNLFILLIFLSVVSCASFVKNSYVTLQGSKDFYFLAMGTVADLQSQGLIDQTKRDQINKVAKVYKEAHNTAVAALEVYKKTNLAEDKQKVVVAIAEAALKWGQLAVLINSIKPNFVPTQLPK